MPKRSNEFQELVTLVQRALAPRGAKVTASALVDVPGQLSQREIDVLIESGVGPYQVKIAVEARDTGRKMDQTQFEGLLAKYQSEGSIKVNKLVIVTHHGYFEPVVERAKLLGEQVELLTYRQAKSADWTKRSGAIRLTLPPHLCHFRFDPPIDGIEPGRIWTNARIICSHGNDRGTPASWGQRVLQKLLVDRPSFMQELSEKAQSEPAGQALGHISFPMNHTLSIDGETVPLEKMGFAVHAVDGHAQVKFTGCEITRTSGETSFVPMAQAEVGGKKLQFVFPDGLQSQLIVLKIDSAEPKKGHSIVGAPETFSRETVVAKLRHSVAEQLSEAERQIETPVRFESLSSHAVADFGVFDGYPTIRLGPGWEDTDVAHELVHVQMELVEGYNVLAWRTPDSITGAREVLLGLVRAYCDDEVVHGRLAGLGLKIDGEIIRPPVFQLCDSAAACLRSRKRDDGMSRFDGVGRAQGEFFRAIRYVQATLLLEKFGSQLLHGHRSSLNDFLETFRRALPRQTTKAESILALFRNYDTSTVAGHSAILHGLAEMEGLSPHVGLTSYRKHDGKFILPVPLV